MIAETAEDAAPGAESGHRAHKRLDIVSIRRHEIAGQRDDVWLKAVSNLNILAHPRLVHEKARVNIAHLHDGESIKRQRQPFDRNDDALNDFARARRHRAISRNRKRHRGGGQQHHLHKAAARQIHRRNRVAFITRVFPAPKELHGGIDGHRYGGGCRKEERADHPDEKQISEWPHDFFIARRRSVKQNRARADEGFDDEPEQRRVDERKQRQRHANRQLLPSLAEAHRTQNAQESA